MRTYPQRRPVKHVSFYRTARLFLECGCHGHAAKPYTAHPEPPAQTRKEKSWARLVLEGFFPSSSKTPFSERSPKVRMHRPCSWLCPTHSKKKQALDVKKLVRRRKGTDASAPLLLLATPHATFFAAQWPTPSFAPWIRDDTGCAVAVAVAVSVCLCVCVCVCVGAPRLRTNRAARQARPVQCPPNSRTTN